jgi:hypothetical protein
MCEVSSRERASFSGVNDQPETTPGALREARERSRVAV